jgi:predicted nucleic acid-binding protein
MSVDCFLDTNVVVYAVSGAPEEAEKRKIAANIMQTQNFAVSPQVMQEFHVTVTRKSELCVTPQQAEIWLNKLVDACCVVLDADMVIRAIGIAERFRISYWDGAIIAAAGEVGAGVIYSEDLSHKQQYGAVRVVNPFAGAGDRDEDKG